MSRILIALVIILVISNVATAIGWAVSTGMLAAPAGLGMLSGPNTPPPAAPEEKTPPKKELVDPDEDSSPPPRNDDAVNPPEDEDMNIMDQVQSMYSGLKSAVMLG